MSRRPRLLPLIVTVLALAVIAVAADLAARTWATARVAQEVRREYGLSEDPRITVAGGSFLWQAARGRFEDVTVTVARVSTGSVDLRDVRIRVPEVDVPRSVLTGGAGTVDVSGGTLRARVPYDQLADDLSVGGLDVALARAGDAVRASTGVGVFGLRVDLAVTGRPVLDGDSVRLEPLEAELAGARVPLARAEQLLEAAGFGGWSFPLRGIPAQVRLETLQVADSGLVVTGSLTPGAHEVG
ncbi:LmeA family phospholipid-binding protein [Kineococcus sp. SYSU DK001]|uniref:LmeA family phospholipid-binding protein n=1 Tax=Kineococcus sp. SYSU DK001 TaxID=3383122 RepID=UPI003D7EE291